MIFLYACTIFLSAFLLFQVQPLIGKMILPWFGGSAAVWSTCMLFFQALLLLGYLYAYLTTRYLTPRRQSLLHVLLLATSIALLPITPNAAWKPVGGEEPTLLIIGLMAASIGLPYFLLSATSPLVQAWFAREKAGSVPYRLFALSNFGSMLGLVSYPLLFEPWLAIPRMSISWSAAYTGFALICGILALRGLRAYKTHTLEATVPISVTPSANTRLLWATLAALPTILLMSITSHLTQNIAPIPLLWVLPLVLYLATFILCFEGGGWYRRAWYLPMFVLSTGGMILFLLVPVLLVWSHIALYCSALFFSCMVCHGELAKLKPHSRYLTSFYLMLATGGAAGGVFVAVVAPRIFNDDYELGITAVATTIAIFMIISRESTISLYRGLSKETWLKATVFTVTLFSTLLIGKFLFLDQPDVKMRNFYGTVKIQDAGLNTERIRELTHGIVLHGFQYLDIQKRRWPTSYFGEKSGVGLGVLASRNTGQQRVGVVGLGAGTIAAYCRPGDYYRFYEINPLVIRFASSKFSFLSDCSPAVEIAQGDARLSLEREEPKNFDLLVIDAFSGDSIPVHLLTREAFGVYFHHLRGGGILAVHISNSNLNLIPVVKLAADYYAKDARLVRSLQDPSKGVALAEWILISDRPNIFKSKELKDVAREIKPSIAIRPWTDDYSSIYAILK